MLILTAPATGCVGRVCCAHGKGTDVSLLEIAGKLRRESTNGASFHMALGWRVAPLMTMVFIASATLSVSKMLLVSVTVMSLINMFVV